MEGTMSGDKDSGVTVGSQDCGTDIKVQRVPGPQHRRC